MQHIFIYIQKLLNVFSQPRRRLECSPVLHFSTWRQVSILFRILLTQASDISSLAMYSNGCFSCCVLDNWGILLNPLYYFLLRQEILPFGLVEGLGDLLAGSTGMMLVRLQS